MMTVIRDGNRVAGASYAHLEKRLTVTQAELRALHTKSVELLPAPAADQMYVVTFVVTLKAAGTAYTTGKNLRIKYGEKADGVVYAADNLPSANVLPGTAAERIHAGVFQGPLEKGKSLTLEVASTLGARGTGPLTLIVGYHLKTGLAI